MSDFGRTIAIRSGIPFAFLKVSFLASGEVTSSKNVKYSSTFLSASRKEIFSLPIISATFAGICFTTRGTKTLLPSFVKFLTTSPATGEIISPAGLFTTPSVGRFAAMPRMQSGQVRVVQILCKLPST